MDTSVRYYGRSGKIMHVPMWTTHRTKGNGGGQEGAAQTRLAVVDMNPISTPPLMLNLSPVVKASGSFRPANPRYTFPPLGVNGPSFDMADEIRLHAWPNAVLLWLELSDLEAGFGGGQSYA